MRESKSLEEREERTNWLMIISYAQKFDTFQLTKYFGEQNISVKNFRKQLRFSEFLSTEILFHKVAFYPF